MADLGEVGFFVLFEKISSASGVAGFNSYFDAVIARWYCIYVRSTSGAPATIFLSVAFTVPCPSRGIR